MLVAFFVGQLFQETVEESPQSEMLIVNMLEEFLKLFCKGSKKRSERKTSRIYQPEIFAAAFLKILCEEEKTIKKNRKN